MGLRVFAAVVLLALVDAVDDFYVVKHGYEFIYHGNYDLLLAVFGDKCYFAHFSDETSAGFTSLVAHRSQMEDHVIAIIEASSTSDIHASSLEEVRERFHDRLADYHCLNKSIYTLHLKPLMFCPPDFIYQNGDSCYFFEAHYKRWYEAEFICKAMGAYLAEVRSKSEHDFLATLITKHLENHHDRGVWLGGTDTVHEGQWTWSTGARLSYSQWGPGQPDDLRSGEDCMEMLGASPTSMAWNDDECFNYKPFICQRRLL